MASAIAGTSRSSPRGVAYAVSGNRHAIGYVSLGFLSDAVKTMRVDGVSPTKENALSGSYPIIRELYMFARGDRSQEAVKFIDFVLSPAGTHVIESEGFLPPLSVGAAPGVGAAPEDSSGAQAIQLGLNHSDQNLSGQKPLERAQSAQSLTDKAPAGQISTDQIPADQASAEQNAASQEAASQEAAGKTLGAAPSQEPSSETGSGDAIERETGAALP